MNYQQPHLRELLAAEYVLGTLHGRPRQRFERLMHDDPALRDLVTTWEQRLMPLSARVERVTPPGITWLTIQQQLGLKKVQGQRWWSSLGWWRGMAAASSALAMALLVYVGVAPGPTTEATYIAVLSDTQARPVILVTATPDLRKIRFEAVATGLATPDRSLELWVLPGPDRQPVSLGLVPLEGARTLELPERLRSDWTAGVGLAVSEEPVGGSPTGQPTGPILFQGRILARG